MFQSVELCYLYNDQQLCLYWLFSFWIKKSSELPVSVGGGFKRGNKGYDKILGIGIPDLLMNLMPCHGFWRTKILLSY